MYLLIVFSHSFPKAAQLSSFYEALSDNRAEYDIFSIQSHQLLAKFCCPTVLDPDVAEAMESARA